MLKQIATMLHQWSRTQRFENTAATGIGAVHYKYKAVPQPDGQMRLHTTMRHPATGFEVHVEQYVKPRTVEILRTECICAHYPGISML